MIFGGERVNERMDGVIGVKHFRLILGREVAMTACKRIAALSYLRSKRQR